MSEMICKDTNVSVWADGTQTIWTCHRDAGHDGMHEDCDDYGNPWTWYSEVPV